LESSRVNIAVFFGFFWATLSATAQDVVAVKSKDMVLFDKALAGFKKNFSGNLKVISLGKEASSAEELVAKVQEAKPTLVLTLGAPAAKALQGEIKDIPIVFLMAPYPKEIKAGNMVGISMDPTPAEQLRQFVRAVPAVRKVAVIYDEKRSGVLVAEALSASSGVGVKLLTYPVSQKKEVPEALEKAFTEADALWLIRDPMVLTKELFNRALVFQLNQKKPIMVQTPSFVKAQAVCSFSSSYESQGRKAAETAKKILAGSTPAELGLQYPDGQLAVNVGSAEKAGITLSPAVLNDPAVLKVGK
jgi:ABC-type uncharacterized transport system substrate-binding protein